MVDILGIAVLIALYGIYKFRAPKVAKGPAVSYTSIMAPFEKRLRESNALTLYIHRADFQKLWCYVIPSQRWGNEIRWGEHVIRPVEDPKPAHSTGPLHQWADVSNERIWN